MHGDMSGLSRLAHELEQSLVTGDVKVEVDFHSTFVIVSRHCIPHTAPLKLGKAHGELAGKAWWAGVEFM